jgi:hypothetical protein
MTSVSSKADGWAVAHDPDEVHALLLASDAHSAARYGFPLPHRNPATTARLVHDALVHGLRRSGELIATFTLTWQPPYAADKVGFPPRHKPLYLRRLAVQPRLLTLGSLLGLQTVRRACEVAAQAGADAVRSETNPDQVALMDLLCHAGFVAAGRTSVDGPSRRAYLQKDITPPAS